MFLLLQNSAIGDDLGRVLECNLPGTSARTWYLVHKNCYEGYLLRSTVEARVFRRSQPSTVVISNMISEFPQRSM